MMTQPSTTTSSLVKRMFYDTCDYGDSGCSDWYYWGRWVVLAACAVFIVFLLSACRIIARRRRRRGARPFYGTGWLAGGPRMNYGPQNAYPMHNYGAGYDQSKYGNPEYGYYNPPPAYGQQVPQQERPYASSPYPADAGSYSGQPGPQSPPQTHAAPGKY